MKTLTVRVVENPSWLAHRCKMEAETGDTTLCPFFGAECPLGLVSCRAVTPGLWAEVLKEEIDEDAES